MNEKVRIKNIGKQAVMIPGNTRLLLKPGQVSPPLHAGNVDLGRIRVMKDFVILDADGPKPQPMPKAKPEKPEPVPEPVREVVISEVAGSASLGVNSSTKREISDVSENDVPENNESSEKLGKKPGPKKGTKKQDSTKQGSTKRRTRKKKES